MKLKTRITIYILLPVIVVFTVVCAIGLPVVLSSTEKTVALGLESNGIAIMSKIYSMNHGEFHVEGESLWRGDYNITEDPSLLDLIKEKTGMVASIYYGDTRYLTSLTDHDGKAALYSKAEPEIVEKVLKGGEEYVDRSVKLYGDKYFAIYMPFYESEQQTGDPVGMVFIGIPSKIANQSAYSVIFKVILLLVVVYAVALVLEIGSISKLSKDLNSAVQSLDQLAEGNLRAEIRRDALRRKDEISRIVRAIMNMKGQMSEMIGAIVAQSYAVQDTAQQISAETEQSANAIGQVDVAVGEISEGATSQATETQRATENVIIMGDMIEQTKEEVQALREHAKDMQVAGEMASRTLAELDAINQRTKEAIDVIYKQTNTTNESALRIQEVTKMITGIAEETNLLSLNAAIEAARAGEQGRGFAVVASQIQKLAEQSNASTEEIAKIINVLISDAERAVATMNDVKDIMDEQSKKVEKTDEAFERVRVGIEASMGGVEKINDKAVKLDSARSNVIDIVQNLTAIAEENAAATEETSASVTEVAAIVEDIAQNAVHMTEFADSLKEKINVFTI